jgi:hypothetical protein
LHAVKLTLADLSHQLLLSLLEALGSAGIFTSPTLSGGGLRAGWYELKGTTIVVHGYSYVPGVNVSGSVSGAHVALVVGGSAAAHGRLKTDAHGSLAGTLGGVRVRLPSRAAATRVAQAAAGSSRGDSLRGPAARLLAPLSDALRQLSDGSIALADLRYLLSSRRLSER